MPKQFCKWWINSPEHEALLIEREDCGNSDVTSVESEQFKQYHTARQSKHW